MPRTEVAGITVDALGRLPTTIVEVRSDGPAFTILNGQTASNDVDPTVAFPLAVAVAAYDDPNRIAAETINLQVSSVAVPAAGDWRNLTVNAFTATLLQTVGLNTALLSARRVRLLSNAAVGATRVFATTYRSS